MSQILTDDDFVTLGTVHPVLAGTFLSAVAAWQVLRPAYCMRVTEGYRTVDRQKWLLKMGKTHTMESYHLTGLAIDVAVLTADRQRAIWDIEVYRDFAHFMSKAFVKFRPLGSPNAGIFWGGMWKSLKDGVHFQLEGFDGVSLHDTLAHLNALRLED